MPVCFASHRCLFAIASACLLTGCSGGYSREARIRHHVDALARSDPISRESWLLLYQSADVLIPDMLPCLQDDRPDVRERVAALIYHGLRSIQSNGFRGSKGVRTFKDPELAGIIDLVDQSGPLRDFWSDASRQERERRIRLIRQWYYKWISDDERDWP